jgi:diguanylate cyclase (GGDEF)-like protein
MLKNGEGGMFVLFDVDRFKSINDTYGHSVGDMVLIEIGKCMRKTFRDKDIVLRLGGDEFAAYTPAVCSSEEGRPVIERLISSISKISIPELKGRKIEISVGAAFYMPQDTFTFDELYKQADGCTYISKKKDGSCVTFYDRTKEA